jgi:uncharacterized protein DUF4230
MGLRALTRLLVVLLIAVGGGAVGWYLSSGGSGSAGIKQTTDLPVVVQQIRALSELVSVKYTVQKVVGLEEKKSPFGAERLLLIVQAEVLGGVELSELREDDVARTSDGGVRIAMPTARVLHVVLNEKETKVWDREVTWWTPWVPANPDLERQARLEALESIKETAFEMGIHEDARRNAEEAIRRLLEAAGVSPVLFVEGAS